MCSSYINVFIIYSVVWGAVVLIISSIVGSGFGIVDINEAALLYDSISLSLEPNTIYMSGKHWIGISKRFIIYPLTAQNLTFLKTNSNNQPIRCKTADKSEVDIEVITYYKLRPEFLYEQYYAFLNRDYIEVYNNLIRSQVQNTISRFNMADLIVNRTDVSQTMQIDINARMRNDLYAELIYFQMSNIAFNSNLEEYLVRNFDSKKEITVQEILKKERQIEGEIQIILSEAQKEAANTLSLAESTANFYLNKASTEISKFDYFAKALAFRPLTEENGLNFTISEFNKFMLANKIDDKTFYETENNYSWYFSDIGD